MTKDELKNSSRSVIPVNFGRDYQTGVASWAEICFGKKVARDKVTRTHRFLEEALELAQATDCPLIDVLALVYYVYTRDVGKVPQEVGGVMVTLAALCEAHEIDFGEEAVRELLRAWKNIDKIRAKQASKLRGSAFPQPFP